MNPSLSMMTSQQRATNTQRACRRRASRRDRAGSAVVELAVCLPLLFTLIFGSIEACKYIHLKNALSAAAHQGALAANQQGATEADVTSKIQDLLDARDINANVLEVGWKGTPIEHLVAGEPYRVRLRANLNQNLKVPRLFVTDSKTVVTASGLKQ